MNLRKIISALMAAAIVASTTTIYSAAADIVETNSIESVFADIDFTEPSVEISTDIIDGYTSIIFSIPAEKIELFKQVKTDNDSRINLKMTVCFGDLSPERDEDVELPMSAYSVAAYLYDLTGDEGSCSVYALVEDTGYDYEPIVKQYTDDNGNRIIVASYENSDDLAETARDADELRIFYHIKNQVKYIDGSYEKYTTKFLKPDIAELKFGKISSKAYTGKALKPTVIVKDSKKKLLNGTDYTVTYKNNKNIGTATVTITGKGEYKGTKTLKFKIVPPKTTLTSKPGKTSVGWNRATLSWKKSAGADGYQIYYSENGGNFKKLTTVSSGKLSRSVRYTTGDTEQFKVRPYKKVNGKTYFGAWSNIITLN